MLKSSNKNQLEMGRKVRSDDEKLLSVEPSFRILYYAASSGSVPFTWESQPGTPKHPFSDTSLPPLTPPPSYQSSHNSSHFNRSKSSFLRTIFPSKKSSRHVSPSISWSSSSGSSGSSYSLPTTPLNWPLVDGGKSHYVRSKLEMRFGFDEVDEKGCEYVESSRTPNKVHGRRRMNKVKNALMSIVGYAKG